MEALDPEHADALQATVCGYDRDEAGKALLACVDLYMHWSAESGLAFERNRNAQTLAVEFLEDLIQAGEGFNRDVERGAGLRPDW